MKELLRSIYPDTDCIGTFVEGATFAVRLKEAGKCGFSHVQG